ncbi:MAG: glycosyltransferase [Actinomycetes bacterium]
MARALPESPVHTSFYEPARTYPDLATLDIRPMPINRVGPLRRHHRLAFPLLAPSFSATSVDADVTVCSTAGWSHGVRTTGAKIAYWHAPARWLYQLDQYAGGRRVMRIGARTMAPMLRPWDRHAVATVDRHLANSSLIRRRIQDLYHVDVELLAPPSTFGEDGPVLEHGIEPGYFLCVARLLPYKNVDVVIEAARRVGARLVVVGRGPEAERLRASSPATTTFLEDVPDARLRALYRDCAALVTAAHEDFGMTPLEAASFGRPSAVLAAGGFLDTVVDGETGIMFERPDPAPVAAALQRILDGTWDPAVLRARAAAFSEAAFAERLRAVVSEVGGAS